MNTRNTVQEFPDGPVVRRPALFTAEDAGSISGGGTKIPQVLRGGQDQNNSNKTQNAVHLYPLELF